MGINKFFLPVFFILLFSISCSDATNNFATAQDALTLDGCFNLALKNNNALIQASKAIDAAQTNLLGTYSAKYPSLNLNGGYSLSGGSGSSNIKNSISTSLSGSYKLYNGGQTDSSIEQAKLNIQLAQENFKKQQIDIFYSIADGFYKILQKEEQIKIAREIVQRKDENLVLIRLRYKAGKETQQTVKEAEADLFQSQHDALTAEEGLRQTKFSLNTLLGNSFWTKLDIRYAGGNMIDYDENKIINEAKHNHPDLKIEKLNIKLKEEGIKQAKSGYAPVVSLNSSVGLQSDKLTDNWTNSWNLGANVSYPLFDGYATRYNIKDAEIALASEKIKLKDLEIGIENEVEQAFINYTLQQKKLAVGEKTLLVAGEVYLLTKLQYKQGLTTYFFLQQKENSLAQAQKSHISDLYNYRAAIAQLKKALGTF